MQYNLSMNEPNIQVHSVDIRGDRSITLRHVQHNDRPLGKTTQEVIKHFHRLWKFDVHLESMRDDTMVRKFTCPEENSDDAKAKETTLAKAS